jgi:hypothetical protein
MNLFIWNGIKTWDEHYQTYGTGRKTQGRILTHVSFDVRRES